LQTHTNLTDAMLRVDRSKHYLLHPQVALLVEDPMANGLAQAHHLIHGRMAIEGMEAHKIEDHLVARDIEVDMTDARTTKEMLHLHLAVGVQIGAMGVVIFQCQETAATLFHPFPDMDLMAVTIGATGTIEEEEEEEEQEEEARTLLTRIFRHMVVTDQGARVSPTTDLVEDHETPVTREKAMATIEAIATEATETEIEQATTEVSASIVEMGEHALVVPTGVIGTARGTTTFTDAGRQFSSSSLFLQLWGSSVQTHPGVSNCFASSLCLCNEYFMASTASFFGTRPKILLDWVGFGVTDGWILM
jgi:hypothetical protein